MIVPIAAGVGSFLLAKASGSSNRDALIAGGIGALGGAFLGGGAMGIAGAGLQGATPLIGGISAGALTAGALQGQPKPYNMEDQMNVGFKGVDPQQYAQATENLQGIGQRATYADAPTTNVAQPSVYDFSNQEMYTAREGGLAEIKRFREGGVNYLPSKTDHDEKDYNNYTRAEGYVEDGSGNGDKDEDTMLAQLADGEFVSRADAILGAGIMEGASPEDFKEMRRLGSKFFYKQQDQLKRIYDITS